MVITGGFGTTLDIERGTSRKWVMGRDGVKRQDYSNSEAWSLCRVCNAYGVRDAKWNEIDHEHDCPLAAAPSPPQHDKGSAP